MQTALKAGEKSIILYETASKPRELFIWISLTENRNSQNKDYFAINTQDMKIISANIVINDNRYVLLLPYTVILRLNAWGAY